MCSHALVMGQAPGAPREQGAPAVSSSAAPSSWWASAPAGTQALSTVLMLGRCWEPVSSSGRTYGCAAVTCIQHSRDLMAPVHLCAPLCHRALMPWTPLVAWTPS